MNSSKILYRPPGQTQQEMASPFEPLHQYREWQHDGRVNADLLEEISFLDHEMERLKTLRLQLHGSQPDVRYIEHRLKDLRGTVEHRKRLLQRYRNDPLAPSWPQGTGKVGRLAYDLKQLWPLPKFCREMLLLDLQGRGDQLRARCPIPMHNDKSPSFVIYTHDDRWHCFGACNTGGDVFDLIKSIYGLGHFTDQVKMLADATGQDMAVPR